MQSKLYVGNLSWETTNQDLSRHFEHIGQIEDAFVIKDRETNKSKGFGFVQMVSELDADTAIAELNGSMLNERKIVVRMANPEGRPAAAKGSIPMAAIIEFITTSGQIGDKIDLSSGTKRFVLSRTVDA